MCVTTNLAAPLVVDGDGDVLQHVGVGVVEVAGVPDHARRVLGHDARAEPGDTRDHGFIHSRSNHLKGVRNYYQKVFLQNLFFFDVRDIS